jgi:uncharacterized membrane protein YpjA
MAPAHPEDPLTTPASNLPNVDQSLTEAPSRLLLWRRRIWLAIRVLFFIQVGMMLVIMPWTLIWTQNSLVAGNIRLHDFLTHGFVRGAVSGLGVINLWIGIADAVNYHE